MQSRTLLVEDIEFARKCNDANRDVSVSARIRKILSDAGATCLQQADVDGYLSRAETLLKRFSQVFPASREVFVLRAPGRINLIGEHTDYNGLPVLPMAVNRDILLAASPRDDALLIVHNMDALRFPPRQFEITRRIEPYPAGDWGNYAKAAMQSVERLFSERSDCSLSGFNGLIQGNIPIASGLASSSALVVAFALAAVTVNGNDIDRSSLAETLARGEQYVGTRGGGMDQTVCLLAEEDHAFKIEFFPIRTQRIALPAGYSFVVCHSLVSAPKSSTARMAYNLRAAESRIAAAMLANTLARITGAEGIVIERLGDLYSKELGLSDSTIDSLVEKTLRKDPYSIGEVARLLGAHQKQVRRSYLDAFSDVEMRSLGKLKLHSRCRHVLSEGRRVRQAAEALRAGEVHEFGRLMYESHESCAGDYEVSVPELDTLVEMARDAGAVGSRLTGAGFGGCTISLVYNDDIRRFTDLIEKRYYGRHLSAGKLAEAEKLYPAERMFVCRAVSGAGELFL